MYNNTSSGENDHCGCGCGCGRVGLVSTPRCSPGGSPGVGPLLLQGDFQGIHSGVHQAFCPFPVSSLGHSIRWKCLVKSIPSLRFPVALAAPRRPRFLFCVICTYWHLLFTVQVHNAQCGDSLPALESCSGEGPGPVGECL